MSLSDAEGNAVFLNLTPKWLLVPAALEEAAMEFMTSPAIMVATGEDSTTYQPTKNVHAGSASVIVEPRLDSATNGTTAWYLLADAAQAETIVVVYLQGKESPTIERADPVDVLGLGWRAYHDCGVAAVDWRGGVRSKGA